MKNIKTDLIREYLIKVKSANKELATIHFGRLRLVIKKHLSEERADKLIKLIKG